MSRFSVKQWWQIVRPHICVVAFFLALSVVYFSPMLKDQEIRQGDVEKFIGMSQEVRDYYEKEGKSSAWTGSMFSGMPAYTIGIWGQSGSALDYIHQPFKVMGEIGILFLSLMSCYFLLLILGVNIPLAALGAIAFSFSSYSIIILEAGHITKAWAMAYMPLVFAGFMLVLRKNYLWGGGLFALALALQIKSNHVQITYYLALFCGIIFIGFVIRQIIEKESWKRLGLILATLVVALVIAVLCNLANLYGNYETSHESIRGKSELSQHIDGKTDKSDGLDKDYAFAWSYGVEETFTLMVPDMYGGPSVNTLPEDSHLAKEIQAHGFRVPKPLQAGTYWGDQPFTSGPVYFGAIICFLFVLSLFVIRNPLKWWMLGGTVFFIFLSWGRNLDSFNTFLFHYLPYYNKFRAVSMALVIPQLVFAIMAACGVMRIITRNLTWEDLRKPFYISLGVTGGLCLLIALLLPFDFVSVADQNYGLPNWYLNAIRADRGDLLRMDAFRSFFFILAAAACLYWYLRKHVGKQKNYILWVLAGLVLIDLWNVDKRYLNQENFVSKHTYRQVYSPSVADNFILKDKDLSYRVLSFDPFSENGASLNAPFNDSHISFYHKSIGGYSPAKLRRYQELIDLKIMPEMQLIASAFKSRDSIQNLQKIFLSTPILDMLNMRYLVFNNGQPPVRNPFAWGNAWFVDQVKMVENADEEMLALDKTNLRRAALVDKSFENFVKEGPLTVDSTASIVMTAYKPDKISYKYESALPGVVVFSEVYYPYGWKAFIDGKQVPHFRTNWILRGMEIPAGQHTVEFRFEPDAYWIAYGISIAASYALLLILIGLLVRGFYKDKWS